MADTEDTDKVAAYLARRHGYAGLTLNELRKQPDHPAAPLLQLLWDEATEHVRTANQVDRQAELLRRHSEWIGRLIEAIQETSERVARIPAARSHTEPEETP